MNTPKQVKEHRAGYRALAFFVRHWGYHFSVLIATSVVFFYFLGQRKVIAHSMEFYGRLFPSSSKFQRFWLTWRQFWNFSMMMLDRLLLSLGLSDKFQLTHDGLEALETNREDGKPAILWVAHVGNWEIASHFLTDYGFKLNVVVGQSEGEGIAAEQKEGMRQAGINLIVVRGESNLESVQLISRLKAGEFVAIGGDRVFHDQQKTLTVDFLGKPATIPAGPYVLSLLSGAEIYPVFGYREGALKYKFKTFPPKQLINIKRADRESALEGSAQACFDDLEAFVKQHPQHWFNFFDFWRRTRPSSNSQTKGDDVGFH